MPKLAPDRLGLLLPWLNGRLETYEEVDFARTDLLGLRTDVQAITRAIDAFVRSFDGSADAGFVVAEPDGAVPSHVHVLHALKADLLVLLKQGFGDQPDDLRALPIANLSIGISRAGRAKPGRRSGHVVGGVVAARGYRAAGAYVLHVKGPVRALVPFLLAQLLTAPEMTTVKRCERPRCQHFIAETPRRGRPQRFCSATCRTWNAEIQEHRRQKRRVR